jgi:hypothetical protein
MPAEQRTSLQQPRALPAGRKRDARAAGRHADHPDDGHFGHHDQMDDPLPARSAPACRCQDAGQRSAAADAGYQVTISSLWATIDLADANEHAAKLA